MKWRAFIALLFVLPLAGCGGSGGGGSGESKVLVGAGSTLVAPLVAQWSSDYAKKTGVTVTYGAIGSGGGIAQLTARTVDFGASDAPLTSDQASACKGCVQVPWALGATLASYNLKGAPAKLKLSGPVLADIFLGKITHWNDPAIAKLNSGATLPATPIVPVYRSDGSGDTYAFTDYLSKVSSEWKSKLGVSTQVSFPKGIGGKGNDGVAAVVGRQNGSIGYLGISYVFGNQLQYALIQNEAGNYPVPGPDTITAAADSVETIPPDNAISITDPPDSASDAYPISTFTYVLFPATSGKAKTLRDFVTYAIGPGQKFGDKLQFAPLPAKVVSAAEQTLARLG
ncbi:MAG TPA: phosphate ABC transporter substrate-binding protein PstS [Gaiellaceae bacterium]|nr:phosphate ABC transporter substrate-binding protein PstS [Gaiellaceae bacterium]